MLESEGIKFYLKRIKILLNLFVILLQEDRFKSEKYTYILRNNKPNFQNY